MKLQILQTFRGTQCVVCVQSPCYQSLAGGSVSVSMNLSNHVITVQSTNSFQWDYYVLLKITASLQILFFYLMSIPDMCRSLSHPFFLSLSLAQCVVSPGLHDEEEVVWSRFYLLGNLEVDWHLPWSHSLYMFTNREQLLVLSTCVLSVASFLSLLFRWLPHLTLGLSIIT